jgi:hypothetical protein
MSFDAALVKEQGITFAVVLVKNHVFNSTTSKSEAVDSFHPYFPGTPIVIARQRNGNMEYYGRKDIVNFLSNLHHSQLPWKKYSLR